MLEDSDLSPYRQIAQLLKPKGIKGQIAASLSGIEGGCEASTLTLLVGLPVYIVPPLLRGVRKTAIVAASPHARGAVLSLQGVEDATLAHQLAGRYLLALASDLPAEFMLMLDNPVESGDNFVGMTVSDVQLGLIGVIREERRGSAQTLWVLEGEQGEVLVPAVDELMVSITESDVLMRLPQGLLEINR